MSFSVTNCVCSLRVRGHGSGNMVWADLPPHWSFAHEQQRQRQRQSWPRFMCKCMGFVLAGVLLLLLLVPNEETASALPDPWYPGPEAGASPDFRDSGAAPGPQSEL